MEVPVDVNIAGCPLGLKKKCVDLGAAGKHCTCLPKDVEVPVDVNVAFSCPLGLKKKCTDFGAAGKHCVCLPKDVEVPVKVAGKNSSMLALCCVCLLVACYSAS